MNKIIGRIEEQKILDDCLRSDGSEFLVIYGRRRIGKTYLIKNYFDNRFSFYATGVFGKKNKEQLKAFYSCLRQYGDNEDSCPKNWFEAFARLQNLLNSDFIKRDPINNKRVVFLDELPWMSVTNSDFKAALDFFWNGYASYENDILFIVCGSATSWILNNLLYDKGGFAHRITRRIHLSQMNLKDCEEFLKYKGIDIPRHQIVEYYMFFGGVPYYYSLIDRRLSLAQNVDELFFSNDGTLKNEFSFLFGSLFKNPNCHISVIKALSNSKSGLTRKELEEKLNDVRGGSLDRTLKELLECDFIKKYNNFTKKTKESIFQIIDPMLLFYLRYVEGSIKKSWQSYVGTSKYNSWCGEAFENVCLLHVKQIKQLLGISGIDSEELSWRSKQKLDGAQIDLLIDRSDKTITICEMKYYSDKFNLDKHYSEILDNKRQVLIRETKTKKVVNIVMITSFGLSDSSNRNIIINDYREDQLFI